MRFATLEKFDLWDIGLRSQHKLAEFQMNLDLFLLNATQSIFTLTFFVYWTEPTK